MVRLMDLLIIARCYSSLPSENIRNRLLMFSGDIDKQHQAVMS